MSTLWAFIARVEVYSHPPTNKDGDLVMGYSASGEPVGAHRVVPLLDVRVARTIHNLFF